MILAMSRSRFWRIALNFSAWKVPLTTRSLCRISKRVESSSVTWTCLTAQSHFKNMRFLRSRSTHLARLPSFYFMIFLRIRKTQKVR